MDVLFGSGLENLGLTCFMNAALQILLNNKEFMEAMAKNRHLKLCQCLYSLFTDRSLHRLTQLREHLIKEKILPSTQDTWDPYQFLMGVFEYMEKKGVQLTMFRLAYRDFVLCKKSCKVMTEEAKRIGNYTKKLKEQIKNKGKLKTNDISKEMGKEVLEEDYTYYYIPKIYTEKSVMDCLHEVIQIDECECPCRYCGYKKSSSFSGLIGPLPKYLFIRLDRGNELAKIIDYTEEIEIKTHPDFRGKTEKKKFELISGIVQIAEDRSSVGHYISYLKVKNLSGEKNHWMCFDDKETYGVSEKTAFKCFGNSKTAHRQRCTIVCYRQKSEDKVGSKVLSKKLASNYGELNVLLHNDRKYRLEANTLVLNRLRTYDRIEGFVKRLLTVVETEKKLEQLVGNFKSLEKKHIEKTKLEMQQSKKYDSKKKEALDLHRTLAMRDTAITERERLVNTKRADFERYVKKKESSFKSKTDALLNKEKELVVREKKLFSGRDLVEAQKIAFEKEVVKTKLELEGLVKMKTTLTSQLHGQVKKLSEDITKKKAELKMLQDTYKKVQSEMTKSIMGNTGGLVTNQVNDQGLVSNQVNVQSSLVSDDQEEEGEDNSCGNAFPDQTTSQVDHTHQANIGHHGMNIGIVGDHDDALGNGGDHDDDENMSEDTSGVATHHMPHHQPDGLHNPDE